MSLCFKFHSLTSPCYLEINFLQGSLSKTTRGSFSYFTDRAHAFQKPLKFYFDSVDLIWMGWEEISRGLIVFWQQETIHWREIERDNAPVSIVKVLSHKSKPTEIDYKLYPGVNAFHEMESIATSKFHHQITNKSKVIITKDQWNNIFFLIYYTFHKERLS